MKAGYVVIKQKRTKKYTGVVRAEHLIVWACPHKHEGLKWDNGAMRPGALRCARKEIIRREALAHYDEGSQT